MPRVQPDGYLALPAAGGGEGVLVLHAWWGLNETIKRFCTRLAESGFVAFAPDLYHGKITDSIAGAEALSDALDGKQGRADVADAAMFLNERVGKGDHGLAMIGFSLGHWFFEPDRPQAFHSAASDLAWDRTLAFLRRQDR